MISAPGRQNSVCDNQRTVQGKEMILVEIHTAATGSYYDMQLDEKLECGLLAQKCLDILCRYLGLTEKTSLTRHPVFISLRQKRILPEKNTMEQCGIKNGDRVILA